MPEQDAWEDTPTTQLDTGSTQRPKTEPRPGSPQRGASAIKTALLDRKPPALAWLVIANGPRAGEIYQLNDDVTAMGRDGMNGLVVDDDAVSAQHARVKLEGDEDEKEFKKFFIYDLASTNGVFLNGERVYRHELADGDRVRIGQTTLVFKRIVYSEDEAKEG